MSVKVHDILKNPETRSDSFTDIPWCQLGTITVYHLRGGGERRIYGDHMFSGDTWEGISRCQQTKQEGLLQIDRRLTANEGGSKEYCRDLTGDHQWILSRYFKILWPPFPSRSASYSGWVGKVCVLIIEWSSSSSICSRCTFLIACHFRSNLCVWMNLRFLATKYRPQSASHLSIHEHVNYWIVASWRLGHISWNRGPNRADPVWVYNGHYCS